jgi:tripartite-type tricarboxylate transporter receptor subunit TctC
MKKLFGLLFAIMTTILVLTACGSSGQDAKTASGKNADGIEFPTKPIELIVPWDAGGSTDLIARTLAKEVEKELGQPVTVVNKPGAGGTLAATEVAKSPADGYKIMISSNSPFTSQPNIKPTQYSIEDFRVVHATTYENIALLTHSNSKWDKLEDLMKEKDSGTTIKYATSGAGGFSHLASATFFDESGLKGQYVPFKSGAETITALLGEQVDIITVHPGEAMEHVKSGKLKFLGVFSEAEAPEIPDVPTFKEKGMDLVWGVYKFIVVPKDVPEDVYQKLNEAFAKAYASDSYKEFLEKSNLTSYDESPEQIEEKIKAEIKETKVWIDKIKFAQ